MPTSKPNSSDTVDESSYSRIPDDDAAWGGPVNLPPPLADPAPPLLNTQEMDWESFERLVLAMARTVDGAYDVRRYGVSGQAQHGLDVVAMFVHRNPSVYQAKRWQAFGASDLEDAVERYARGRRPFGADRVVIAVAGEARHTQVIEKLAELRAMHQDLEIDLWDRQAISDRLRSEPRLVTTFFGAATAAAYCVSAPHGGTPAPAVSIAADAILRGPVAHLGLADELRRGTERIDEAPAEAAQLLAQVADRLESSGFVPHAEPLRELQARALRAADRRIDEAWVRINVAWRQLGAGDTFSASIHAREVGQWVDAPVEVARCTSALSAALGWRRDYGVTLDDLAAAFDALDESDPYSTEAALVLSEDAVAARRTDIVEARTGEFKKLADQVPQNADGKLTAARLRMCVADAADGWNELASTARDTYPPDVTALILARSARHLALMPEPQASLGRWRDAIERACVEGLNDDAAEWLYALRTVRVQHGLIDADIDDLHRHAQALRATGSGSCLPEAHRARERALAYLRDQKWPDALEALRRYLWRSTIGGDWTGELEGLELLGDLFARTGRVEEAIRHYVFAGKIKKLEELAAALPESPTRLPLELVTPRPWERAAAFSFAAAHADLIIDRDAAEWCTAALREVIDEPQPLPVFAPNPALSAFKAFGALALVSTEDQATQFLALSQELVPRSANRYRFTDDAHIQALIGIARAHSAVRGEAVDQLLEALVTDQGMAENILRNGVELLRENPTRTASAVRAAAAAGNFYAALALVIAETDVTNAVPVARQRTEAALTPRVHQPGVRTFGTLLPQTATLARVLPVEERVRFARGMLLLASDEEDTPHNRSDALIAMHAIAEYLPEGVRDELFSGVLPFAEGRRESGALDGFFDGSDDPLQRLRFSLGGMSLAWAGVVAAARLARKPHQYASVLRTAELHVRGDNDAAAHSAALAISFIPAEHVSLSVELLAFAPTRWARALAAWLWANRADEPEELGLRLARDPSLQVRLGLAREVRIDEHTAAVRELLSGDPRRSVRWRINQKRPP